MDLPAYDFVKSMRELDNSIIKENEQWALRLSPMFERSELTLDQIRSYEANTFKFADVFPMVIVRNVFQNVRNREVRDLILRHSGEEMGHSELHADFLEYGLGLNRQQVWDSVSMEGIEEREGFFSDRSSTMSELRKECPELAYATIPFSERIVPMSMRRIGRALREQYGFKDNVLGFFDLHTYIDIYHERFGVYIMAKYGTTARARELFQKEIESQRRGLIEGTKAAYSALKLK